MPPALDLSDCFPCDEGLPRPRWDMVHARVEAAAAPEDRGALWADATRRWLEMLRPALVPKYRLLESEHFQLLTWLAEDPAAALLRFAEKCRRVLLAELPGLAAFDAPGKMAILAFKRPARYYTYLAAFYPEGRYGGSVGVQVRSTGRPHVALRGPRLLALQSTLAHELTHAALVHLKMPLWVEEGLTQKFQNVLAGQRPLQITGKTGRQHKRHWTRQGLVPFWTGAGFHKPGRVQRLCYELAEILQALLTSQHQPRWLGMDQGPPRRLAAFLAAADKADCGEAAARAHLGVGLGDLAARFLGPGDWSPAPVRAPAADGSPEP